VKIRTLFEKPTQSPVKQSPLSFISRHSFEELTGESKRPAEFVEKHKRPWIHLSGSGKSGAAERLKDFVEKNQIRVLNIAGFRSLKEQGVGAFVREVLDEAFVSQQLRMGDESTN
jgi:hypothetical protein